VYLGSRWRVETRIVVRPWSGAGGSLRRAAYRGLARPSASFVAGNHNTNGALAVDSTNGRICFRYGGGWHYVNQTAGFEVPAHGFTSAAPEGRPSRRSPTTTGQ